MFVRVKRVKGRNYGYLVKNTWTKKGPRQKVIKYIGAVLQPDKTEGALGRTNGFLQAGSAQDMITGLIARELLSHGFSEESAGWHVRDSVRVHPGRGVVLCKGRAAAIMMNEGFLCTPNISELRKLVEGGAMGGLELANSLLEAGICIQKEEFVEFFMKLSFQTQS
jgi:hypothetical protein